MPVLPVSKTQLDKLGDRLRDAENPTPADRDLLEQVLDTYDEILRSVATILRELGLHPSERLKTTGTIIDKLRRDRSCSLKTIQDLAGARVVLEDADLRDQDDTVRRFTEKLDSESIPWSITDRRSDPRSGYRAVHVVVKIDSLPVEVQFRTELQDLWAQFFERLADRWGRQIRYGGSPDPDPQSPERTAIREFVVAEFQSASSEIAELEYQGASARARLIEQSAGRYGNDPTILDEDVPSDLEQVFSDYRRAAEARRHGTAVIKLAFSRLAESVESKGQLT